MAGEPPDGPRGLIATVPPPGQQPYAHLQPVVDELSRWGHKATGPWSSHHGRDPESTLTVEGAIDLARLHRTLAFPPRLVIKAHDDGRVSIGDPDQRVSISDEGPRRTSWRWSWRRSRA